MFGVVDMIRRLSALAPLDSDWSIKWIPSVAIGRLPIALVRRTVVIGYPLSSENAALLRLKRPSILAEINYNTFV